MVKQIHKEFSSNWGSGNKPSLKKIIKFGSDLNVFNRTPASLLIPLIIKKTDQWIHKRVKTSGSEVSIDIYIYIYYFHNDSLS